ncbi:MAG: hypothetical protein IPH97_03740 [Ignavibacteriales bacterium]|nr:hypothetical protein [Ignavibacteriales bacterium]
MIATNKNQNSEGFVKRFFLPMLILGILSFFVACQDESTIQPEADTDEAALLKIADEDSALSSFDPNFDEGSESEFLGKTNTDIYPFKVGHHMKLVNRNLNITFEGDTAYGVLTKTFDGTLFIKGSYDPNATNPDTLIKKVFSATVTRNIVFIKIANTTNRLKNWRIAAISLPEGGTQSPNIDITKLTAFLPNGDTLVINSPNDYYLVRNWGYWWRWNHIPTVLLNQDVTLRVELNSAYADSDFVTLTFGADRNGMHRVKKQFELVSSTQNGNIYEKVYERTFTPNHSLGFHHAIINAMPKQVVYDDQTAVEMESWGIPYYLRLFPF